MEVMVWGAIASLLVLVLVELGLRWRFGLGTPVLYCADPQIGYLLAPNQQVRRFGNHVLINQFSMRSGAIAAVRPENMLRVLLLGDSIANGGSWTNQPDIISEQMQRLLQPLNPLSDQPLHKAWTQAEVLNASASSWGPRNQLAYLKQFGSFEAQVLILLINTDDLFAAVPTSAPVGRDRHYPSRRPRSALTEALGLVCTKLYPPPAAPTPNPERDPVGANLAAIAQMGAIAQHSGADFILAMTPLQREIIQPRDYELQTRQRLDRFVQQQQMPYLDFLPLFRDAASPTALFRDHIHLSPDGTQLVSGALTAAVCSGRQQSSS